MPPAVTGVAMGMKRSGWGVAVLMAGLCPEHAAGADMDLRGLGAGLYVDRREAGITDGQERLELRVDRVGIRLSERVNRYLRLGLEGGILAAEVAGQTVAGALRPSGNFLGVTADGAVFEGPRGGLDYRLGLGYRSTEDEAGGTRVELDWWESELSLGLRWVVASMVSVYAGSRLGDIDLDRRIRGAVDARSTFGELDRTTVFAGLIVEVNPGGSVGLTVWRGGGDGFTLAFSREY